MTIASASSASKTPACQVGMCANSPWLASPAVWLLPQADIIEVESARAAKGNPARRYTWRFVLTCESHSRWWWDGDEPPPGLPHYRLVDAPVVNHSPQWPVGPVGVE